MKLSPKSAGLLFALAQQIMGAVVPHDRPERMLGQAHSLLYHLFILFDTKHNLLFLRPYRVEAITSGFIHEG